MLEAKVRIVNPLGLHARAAAQLIRLAGQYRSTITLLQGDQRADARSILDILDLAARNGIELIVTAEGDDETEALDAVTELFCVGFGEI